MWTVTFMPVHVVCMCVHLDRRPCLEPARSLGHTGKGRSQSGCSSGDDRGFLHHIHSHLKQKTWFYKEYSIWTQSYLHLLVVTLQRPGSWFSFCLKILLSSHPTLSQSVNYPSVLTAFGSTILHFMTLFTKSSNFHNLSKNLTIFFFAELEISQKIADLNCHKLLITESVQFKRGRKTDTVCTVAHTQQKQTYTCFSLRMCVC